MALLGLGASSALGSASTVVVVVIIVVGLQDTLSQLLLSAVDVCIQFVTVFPDRELLVVVDWDVDAPRAHWLVLRVVELGHIGMSQSLISG